MAIQVPDRYRVDIRAFGDTGFLDKKNLSDNQIESRVHKALNRMEGLRSLDINFLNWEASINSNCKQKLPKKFQFVTPKRVVKPFKTWGFNLFGLANNHSLDCYKPLPTFSSMERIRRLLGGAAFHGVGGNLDYLKNNIAELDIRGVKIGLISLTKWSFENRNYIGNFENRKVLMRAIAKKPLHIRVLSLHGGVEKSRVPHSRIRQMSYEFIGQYGGDIVFAHHPHRIQGTEIVLKKNGKYGVIFYSLGNFLHYGLSRTGDGMMARVEVSPWGINHYSIKAYPLKEETVKPRPVVKTELYQYQSILKESQKHISKHRPEYGLKPVSFKWKRIIDEAPGFVAAVEE